MNRWKLFLLVTTLAISTIGLSLSARAACPQCPTGNMEIVSHDWWETTEGTRSLTFQWTVRQTTDNYRIYVGTPSPFTDLDRFCYLETTELTYQYTCDNMPRYESSDYEDTTLILVRYYTSSWSYVGQDYVYVYRPHILSPAEDSYLPDHDSVTVHIDGGPDFHRARYYIGTALDSDYYCYSGYHYDTSWTCDSSNWTRPLPSDGSEVKVRVYMYNTDGLFSRRDDNYTKAFWGMTSPENGSTFTSTSQTFTWHRPRPDGCVIGPNSGLQIGTSAPGSNDILQWQNWCFTHKTVSNLPDDGSPVYVRLWYATKEDGSACTMWDDCMYRDYTYTAWTDIRSDLNLVGADITANLAHQGCLDFGTAEECTCPEEKGTDGLCYPSVEDERIDDIVNSEIVYGTSVILRAFVELDPGASGDLTLDLSQLEVKITGTRLDTWRPETHWPLAENAVEWNGLDSIDTTISASFPVEDGEVSNSVEMAKSAITSGYRLLDEADEDDAGVPSDIGHWLHIDGIDDEWWYSSSNLPIIGIGDPFDRIRATLKEHNSTLSPRDLAVHYSDSVKGIYLVIHFPIDTSGLTPGRWAFDLEVDPDSNLDEHYTSNNYFPMNGEVNILVPDSMTEPAVPALAIDGEVADQVCSVVSSSPMTFHFDTARPRFDSSCGNDYCGCGFCPHPRFNYFDGRVENFRKRNMWFHEILGRYGTGMYWTEDAFGYGIAAWVPFHCPNPEVRSEDCHSLVPPTPSADEMQNIIIFFAGNSGDGRTQSITGQSESEGCQKHLDNDDITVVPGIWDDPNGAQVPDPALGGDLKRLYVKRALDSSNYQSVFVDDDDGSVWNDCEPPAKHASVTAVLLNQIATMAYTKDPDDRWDPGLTARNTFFLNVSDHGNKVFGPFLETGGETVEGLLDGYLALLKNRSNHLDNVKRIWFAGSSKGGIMALLLMKWLKQDLYDNYSDYESRGLTIEELNKMVFVVTVMDPVANAGDNQFLPNDLSDPNESVRFYTRDTNNYTHPVDYDLMFPNDAPRLVTALARSNNLYIMSIVSDGSGAMNAVIHPTYTGGPFRDYKKICCEHGDTDHCEPDADDVSHDGWLFGQPSRVYLRQQAIREIDDNVYEYGCGRGSHAHLSMRWKDIKDLEFLRFFFDATGLNCPEPGLRHVSNGVHFYDSIRRIGSDFCLWGDVFTPEQRITCGGEE